MKRIVCFAIICAVAAIPAVAQTSRFTGFVGGGFSEPVQDIGSRLDVGWNAAAGVGVNFHPNIGLMLDFMYNDLAINRSTLNNIQVPNGSTRTWGFTLDPVIRLNPRGQDSHVEVYATGGGGIYHRTVEFTQPAIATVPVFDPFFGVYPVDIATNQVIASHSNTKGGLDIGAGIAVGVRRGVNVFAEARYHYIFTGPTATTLLPVTFGLRW